MHAQNASANCKQAFVDLCRFRSDYGACVTFELVNLLP